MRQKGSTVAANKTDLCNWADSHSFHSFLVPFTHCIRGMSVFPFIKSYFESFILPLYIFFVCLFAI